MDHSGDENTNSGMNENHSFVNDNIRNTVDTGKRLFDDNSGKGDDSLKESMIDGDFMVDLVVDEDALYDDDVAQEQLNLCVVDDDQIRMGMMDFHGNTDDHPSNPSLSDTGNQRNLIEDEFFGTNVDVYETPGDTRYWCPRVDQNVQIGLNYKFESIAAADDAYKKYATAGFVMRRSNVKRNRHNVITNRYFVCSKQGFPAVKDTDSTEICFICKNFL